MSEPFEIYDPQRYRVRVFGPDGQIVSDRSINELIAVAELGGGGLQMVFPLGGSFTIYREGLY